MFDLQMPRIKKLKMFIFLCFYGKVTTWPSEILQKSCNFKANFLASANKNMHNVYTLCLTKT